MSASVRLAPLLATFGRSRIAQQLRDELTRVAALDSSLLLVGEAGSGREALARFTHEAGPRAAQRFVSLVASGIPDDNPEGFLFGSGVDGNATQGVLDQARGGTLFIQEIEDLAPRVQRLLLGVVETGAFHRVGGAAPVAFNARIIATAQPGVEDRAGTTGGLRRDLLAHLSSFCRQDYPGRFEVVRGVQRPDDPAVDVVEAILAAVGDAGYRASLAPAAS